MKIYKTITVLLLAMLMGYGVAQAQIVTTPYSKMGYGMLNDNVSSIQRSMGGVGYAMEGGRIINVMNPASYSDVDSLTFLWDVGIELSNLWSKENGNKGYNFGAGLDYLTGHFKVAKGLGASFGLLPYSSVGYTYGGKISGGSEVRSGSGGISQLFLGVGYEPVKNLSVGVNFAYLFGSSANTTLISSNSSSYFTRNFKVRDWNAQVGVQYSLPLLKNRDRLTLGVTFQPKKSFHGHAWGTSYDTQDNKADTIGYTSMKGNYEQPYSIGMGVSYVMDHRLTLEADYTFQKWSNAKYTPIPGIEAQDTKFDDRWKLALGMQYTPNRRGSYFGAMSFRAGAFFTHDYMKFDTSNLRDYGFSVGVGLPAPGSKTTINLGVEWRHREATPVNLISENYLNITLGVNFNELWFWKSRIR